MTTTKFSVIAVSVLLAATSAFAWSKKSENTGNLGRMYLSIEGGMNATKMKTGAETSSPTGAAAGVTLNAPVFKPNVNAFRDISWLGLDAQGFFNYNYSGNYEFVGAEYSETAYGIGVALVPYLNFETGLSFLKAIKPYGKGFCGYMWKDKDLTVYGTGGGHDSENSNYFFYGVGAGVEFVLLDELSITPSWQWNGNAQSGSPVYQTAGVEATYWVNDMFSVSAFWTHSFGYDSDEKFDSGSYILYSLQHGDVIGLKFKLGFTR